MKCEYKNYLYIYNIKLIEENTLLIEKKTIFKHIFILLVLKNFFINSTKQVFIFLRTKIVFQIQFQTQLKKYIKKYSQKLFSKTVLKNNHKICLT